MSADTKDAVKLAMGLVATMSALVLGLLVTSVKGAYDTRKGEVIQMAAKVAFIDRVLKAYGPEADEVRRQFREMVEEDTRRLWPREDDIPAQFRPNGEGDDSVFIADQLQRLVPRDDTQRSLKTQATTLVMEFGQLRSMLTAQSVASISRPMLIVVICWLESHSQAYLQRKPLRAQGGHFTRRACRTHHYRCRHGGAWARWPHSRAR